MSRSQPRTRTEILVGILAAPGLTTELARKLTRNLTARLDERFPGHRWRVERSLAWLLANRRLTVRYERRANILQAFLHLACALICARKLRPL